MLILESKTQLERQIKKAKSVRCKVKYICFGQYQVQGSKGNFYTVRCEKVGTEKRVSCTCQASLKNFFCYHIASAVSLHIGLARQR